MKERPVIFNGEMVRAILDGRKTQTRRVMKVQPSEHFHPMNMSLELDYSARWYTPGVVDKDGYLQPAKGQVFGVAGVDEGYACPFGAVGDRLWVRETWAEAGASAPDLTLYRANYPAHVPAVYENVPAADEIIWRPSIHMPRWACRITLEITAVRVERLNDISEEDAKSEGVAPSQHIITPPEALYRVGFLKLWQSIYGAENWSANPWVWIIEFKQVSAREVERG
ncbi:hypothetical protein [Serratia nevei]|uniref:hypothetical protein n=1 Tax=Serratia nevei TaxID=2703794 RepID=UPI003AF629EA